MFAWFSTIYLNHGEELINFISGYLLIADGFKTRLITFAHCPAPVMQSPFSKGQELLIGNKPPHPFQIVILGSSLSPFVKKIVYLPCRIFLKADWGEEKVRSMLEEQLSFRNWYYLISRSLSAWSILSAG